MREDIFITHARGKDVLDTTEILSIYNSLKREYDYKTIRLVYTNNEYWVEYDRDINLYGQILSHDNTIGYRKRQIERILC